VAFLLSAELSALDRTSFHAGGLELNQQLELSAERALNEGFLPELTPLAGSSFRAHPLDIPDRGVLEGAAFRAG
jgi:hypothetical protein